MNSKVSFGFFAIVFAAILFLFFKVYQSERIAFIDTGKLMEGAKDMQAFRKAMEKEQGQLRATIDTMTVEFQNALKDYEKNSGKMTAKEKDLSQQLLKNKQTQLIQYQQAVEQKFQSEQQRKSQELLKALNAEISTYGEKHNYKLIFATTGGNIAYGDKGVDITEEILKQINN